MPRGLSEGCHHDAYSTQPRAANPLPSASVTSTRVALGSLIVADHGLEHVTL